MCGVLGRSKATPRENQKKGTEKEQGILEHSIKEKSNKSEKVRLLNSQNQDQTTLLILM